MADFDNFSALNENFDTIKTLLNSIRAQGILNTSDVDKLLTGIHSKLEKINTEEDIDLIKIFLSELKQNLDERHGVLVSKFGAIESLFSNLLKNSSEMPKSTELKELFDIVATNLSVFSREVVSQKESLTDITLRLDALRSDDSQKKDIIKNISLLRPELERLNNGFDSIVVNLNDNFKNVIKSISAMDSSNQLDKFASAISGMEMSSNTILSALQMIDKKTEQVEESLKNVATKDDIVSAKQKLFELSAQGQELSTTVTNLSERYLRIDNLAEKIDASVSIVAGLKSFLEESENNNAKIILDEISKLEVQLENITTDTKFEDFKVALNSVLNNISGNVELFNKKNNDFIEELRKLSDFASSLDIGSGFQTILSNITKTESELKNYIEESTQKTLTLQDANITRVLNDITSNAEALGTKLNQTQSEIAVLCEKNFGSVFTSISDLKNVVAQIDENSVSANNAIFSSITDRLTVFENSLKVSLDTQEQTVTRSSAQLAEQVENIKNLSNVLDYKMDSSVVEVGNIKREFTTLKTAIEELLALDFINAVKDLRVDLYASKQELANTVENSTSDLSNKFTEDIYGKYELLISKLDNVEDEFKKTQATSLNSLKTLLENISGSIVDVLSYVSESAKGGSIDFDSKIDKISDAIKENNLNYVESVRDVVDIIRIQVENNLKNIEEENQANFDLIKKSISENSEDLKKEFKYSYSKLLEIQDSYKELKELINVNNLNEKNKFDDIISAANTVKEDFEGKLSSLRTILLEKISDFKQEFTCENADKVSELKFSVENLYSKNSEEVTGLVTEIKDLLTKSTNESATTRAATLAKILDNFVALKDFMTSLNSDTAKGFAEKVEIILEDFSDVKDKLTKVDTTIDEDLTRQLSIIESNFESLVCQISILFEKSDKALSDKLNNEFTEISDKMQTKLLENLEAYKSTVENSIDSLQQSASAQSRYIQEKITELNNAMKDIWENQSRSNFNQIEEFTDNLKSVLDENIKLTAADYETLQKRIDEFAEDIDSKNSQLNNDLKTFVADILRYIDSVVEAGEEKDNQKLKELTEYLNKNAAALESLQQIASNNNEKASDIENLIQEHSELTQSNSQEIAEIKNIENKLVSDIEDLKTQVDTQIDLAKHSNSGVSIITQWGKEHSAKAQNYFNAISALFTKNEEKVTQLETVSSSNQGIIIAKADEISATAKSIEEKLETVTKEQQEVILLNTDNILNETENLNKKLADTEINTQSILSDIENVNSKLAENSGLISNLEATFSEKVVSLKALTAEISAGELQALDAHINNLSEQIEASKECVKACNEILTELLKKELKTITTNVEKETDVIINELIEQFDLLKKSQADDIVELTSRIEEIVNAHIYNNIEDLKSYLDIKTDNSVITCKLDNLKNEMTSSVEEVMGNINRLLDSEAFSTALSDFRVTNEILITSTSEKLNKQIETFVGENIQSLSGVLTENNNKIENKLALFDKKFIDTVVDKYEEIKLLSNKYNDSIGEVRNSVSNILSDFSEVKFDIDTQIKSLIETLNETNSATNAEIRKLNDCFENLRSQISNKSFDEAFQASINKQIASLETLIIDQLGYIEDISELCANNLPDVSELNTLVKHSILESIKDFNEKLESQNIEEIVEAELKQTKTDIITQIINIFNQISFAAEQEEILDFIQEKHDELITVLSHIVTTSNNVDYKIDNLKDEIGQINEKINSIISSNGDIDYIYSLQDLESDIANLRIALKDIQSNNNSKEFSDLISSTNEIYGLMEAIKTELPNRKDFESMAEDIVSISSRTNKLILASDESYKTLQDNLEEFKLVVNDLDERTRNFAQESGLDKIDNKLNAINSMMQNGAKTNQVFNQVFEYLAEWVDNASIQINSISDKIVTLDEIGQIKTMIQDMKSEAADSTETLELVEALGTVFDKQTKRISSLETKLDKIIVETTINNKFDISPIEDTLNRFLVAMEEKLSSQQAKINNLESKLGEVMNLLDEKDTAQLTKKVGGMDRQIAKLNKSIEKIASHVVEK